MTAPSLWKWTLRSRLRTPRSGSAIAGVLGFQAAFLLLGVLSGDKGDKPAWAFLCVSGFLVAMNVSVLGWADPERRAFLRALPFSRARIAGAEALADLSWSLAIAVPLLLMLVPSIRRNGLLPGALLAATAWGCAAALPGSGPRWWGIALRALLGAAGPFLLVQPWIGPRGPTPYGVASLAAAAGILLWISVRRAARRPVEEEEIRIVRRWTSDQAIGFDRIRLPLPIPRRSVLALLARGNGLLALQTAMILLFAAFAWILPANEFLLMWAGIMGINVASALNAGLIAGKGEFLLSRPVGRRGVCAAILSTGLLLSAILPVSGLLGAAFATDGDLVDWIKRAERRSQVGPRISTDERVVVQIDVEATRRKTIENLGLSLPLERAFLPESTPLRSVPSPELLAACRVEVLRLWRLAFGIALLSLLVTVSAGWDPEIARRPLRVLGMIAVTLLLISPFLLLQFGIRIPLPPAWAVAALLPAGLWLAWRRLTRLETS